MDRHIRVRGIRRKEIDEDKLALAFLLLAKTLHEQNKLDDNVRAATDSETNDDAEAA